MNKFYKYLGDNLKYPAEAKAKKSTGKSIFIIHRRERWKTEQHQG